MLYLLKRHPVPIETHFRHVLVLTYALPARILEPLLAPGLTLDTFGEWGFVAVAMVQTEKLRPAGWPRVLGRDFFLAGYRIFARYTTLGGTKLRGLRILRSDTDQTLMALGGNLLTHYAYCKANVQIEETPAQLKIEVITPRAEADLRVRADLSSRPAPLPDGSPFQSLDEARRFAGPLPYTFDYEAPTHSLILVKGIRKKWDPQPVRVEVEYNTFFNHGPFASVSPLLANAFHLQAVPYRWERGRREALAEKL